MRTGAQVLALAAILGCIAAPLHAAETWSPVKMKPRMAVSLDRGDKHIVSYFLARGGACELTLVIGDSLRRLDEFLAAKPSRIVAGIASGKSAKFDTTEGKALSFSCEHDARSMIAMELDRLAAR